MNITFHADGSLKTYDPHFLEPAFTDCATFRLSAISLSVTARGIDKLKHRHCADGLVKHTSPFVNLAPPEFSTRQRL